MLREKCTDIKSVEYLNGKKIVELAEGQVFYKTNKCWEIWQENVENIFRVTSISRKKIGWVNTY